MWCGEWRTVTHKPCNDQWISPKTIAFSSTCVHAVLQLQGQSRHCTWFICYVHTYGVYEPGIKTLLSQNKKKSYYHMVELSNNWSIILKGCNSERDSKSTSNCVTRPWAGIVYMCTAGFSPKSSSIKFIGGTFNISILICLYASIYINRAYKIWQNWSLLGETCGHWWGNVLT